MSQSLNSLKGVIQGISSRTITGLIKRDTRSYTIAHIRITVAIHSFAPY